MLESKRWRRLKGLPPRPVRSSVEELEPRFALAAGDLDLSFDMDGTANLSLSATTDRVYAVALQPIDGKIIAVGSALIGSNRSDFAVARFLSDGRLDPSFNAVGFVTTPFGTGVAEAHAVALQPDGKIVVAGWATFGGVRQFALARYNVNGSLDGTFGIGGLVQTDIGVGDDKIFSVALQGDRIVVAGVAYMTLIQPHFAIARYTSQGQLDPAFGVAGVRTHLFDPNDTGAEARSVAIRPDGRIVAAGFATRFNGTDFFIARYHANGAFDTTFDSDGKALTDFGGLYDEANAVALTGDKIVVAGTAGIFGHNSQVGIVRYNDNGSLDTTFDNDGKRVDVFSSGAFEIGQDIAIQPDGKVLVSGFASQTRVALARYNQDGTLDAGFVSSQGGGVATTQPGIITFQPGVNQSGGHARLASGMAVQNDGRIIVAYAGGDPTGSGQDFALARFIGTPPAIVDLDPFFVDGPASAVAGGAVPITTDVDNIGTAASGNFEVAYYLSTDATITATDTLLKTVTQQSIPARSFLRWVESVTLPSTRGNFFLGVIVDPTNRISEGNEGNNGQADGAGVLINDNRQYVSGPGAHTQPVKLFDADSLGERPSFTPYTGFTGGVRVAAGDIDGDGISDVVTGPGPDSQASGPGRPVLVFSGADRRPFRPIVPYPGFHGGVFVATGDVNGDGRVDIITGAGSGGGPHVRVFNGIDGLELFGFFAYDVHFTGGVAVAASDVNRDGKADIITGAGPGGGPHVRVFSGADRSELFGFFAYHPSFIGGVFVGAGDVNGDGRADIITGAGAGGGPHVRVISGLDRSDLHSFFVYPPGFTGGVRVAAADLNGDGRSDIITGAGPGGGPHVRGFSGFGLAPLQSFFAYDIGFTGGVFVAGAPSGSESALLGPAGSAVLEDGSGEMPSQEQWDLIRAVALMSEERDPGLRRLPSLELVDALYGDW